MITSLAFAQQDEIVVIKIPTPAMSGQQSNYDVTEIRPEGAAYLLNADVSRHPGMIRRRLGIKTTGSNAVKVYGAHGLFIPERGWKQIVGVTDTTISSNAAGAFYFSDTFGLSLSGGYSNGRWPAVNVYHDWTPFKGMLIHADGVTLPQALTAIDGDSIAGDFVQDTVSYRRRVVNMEAPGQLRATPLNVAGNLTGIYEYRLHFTRGYDVFKSYKGNYVEASQAGVISNIVVVRGQKVLLSLFDSDEGYFSPDDTTRAYIARRRLYPSTAGSDSFYLVDTISYHKDARPVYVDNFSDATLNSTHGRVSETESNVATPGSPTWAVRPDTTILKCFRLYSTYNTDSVAKIGTAATYLTTYYRYRFSYYDPTTDIESPMGRPSFYGVHWMTNAAPDTLPEGIKWPAVKSDRADWIRLYRNVATAGIAGWGDTNVWYLIGQFRANGKRNYEDVSGDAGKKFFATGTSLPDKERTRVFYGAWVSDLEL